MITILFNIIDSIIAFLPDDPFNSISLNIAEMEWLSFMNWILPLDFILSVLEIWIATIGIYLVYKLIKKVVGIIISFVS